MSSPHLNEVFLKLLAAPNIASSGFIIIMIWKYGQYIRPGEADASLIMPLQGSPAGVALSVDGNPYYGEISAFWGGANAIAESMRNVAAIGATPRAFTDCLNFGNPEVPEDFYALEEGIRGLAEAAKNLFNPFENAEAIPFVSGNVSLYNQSASGKSIPPSPIVACLGVIQDASRAITMEIKLAGSEILLVGERFNELGGSEYYQILGLGSGANVPQVRYECERGIIYGTIRAIDQKLVLSAHDISNGGLITSAAEMLLATHPDDDKGLILELNRIDAPLRDDLLLFSESGGMLLEVAPENVKRVQEIYQRLGVQAVSIGRSTNLPVLQVMGKNTATLIELETRVMRKQWRGEYGLTLAS